jgi:hypothetical protein
VLELLQSDEGIASNWSIYIVCRGPRALIVPPGGPLCYRPTGVYWSATASRCYRPTGRGRCLQRFGTQAWPESAPATPTRGVDVLAAGVKVLMC